MTDLPSTIREAIIARYPGESVGELARALDVWTYQIREVLREET